MGLTAKGIIFKSAVPKQAAADIARAVAFYEQRLGFSRTFVVDDYAGLVRGDVDVLETKPWGMKEFTILDLDGNGITFCQLA